MTPTPSSYEDLMRDIHARYGKMSKSYQRIAEFLTQNPNDVAVMPVQEIAQSCDMHASNVGRFAKALGFGRFKEMQVLFQHRLSRTADGVEERRRALGADLDEAGGAGTLLRDLVMRDMASLDDLLETVRPEDIEQAADMLERADTIHLLGQLRSAPVVMLLRYVLTMLGKRCVVLDESGGLATHRARLAVPSDLLFVVSFRFYADEVVQIADEAQGRGVPVLAISDSTLSPLAKSADLLFTVPERQYTFSRSLAGPMCLAQAIVVALAARLSKDDDAPRIPVVTQP